MMNRTTPDQEQAPASEPVWERPWSVEEIRRSSQSWSLAADAGLLQFLQEFSQQTISRTHEIKKQVDGLIRETKATDCRLHNVFNDFLMLSNTQFIENRVYDEEVEEPVFKAEAEKTEQEKTREQKEVDLIPKVQEAVNYGLQVLDSAFEQLDIKAGNSDSEEDDANGRVELILEPKDLYIDRPLPYLIGSKPFMEQEDVGLGELSSEEGSVGSDRGSIVDTEEDKEEEESDEDFANHSDNDQNRVRLMYRPPQSPKVLGLITSVSHHTWPGVLIYILCFKDQWNIPASQTHSASDSRSKGEPRDSGTLQGQEAKAVKKTSLFEEDEEDDLFAIAKDSQKKTQRVSLLFEDDADSGGSLFGSPPTSVPPATMKKETVSEAPPLLFSDEEEKEAPLGVKPVDKKVESAKESSEFGRTDVAESEKEGLLTRSAQEVVKHSDLFSSSSPLDKGTKARTKTVLSLFDEEEDKMEDQNSIQAPQKEVGKGRDPDTRPKSTGVFQDEELLFSHKLQKDNDPDVDLFAGTKKPKLLEPSVGSLFGDDEDDDLFSSAKSQPLVQEKKRVVKKDHSVDSFKNQKHPESIQGSKEKGLWKPETPQESSGLAPFKTKEPSTRIGKIQANLAINPAALLPTAAPQISEVKPVLPELAFPSSEHRRSHGQESVPVLLRSGEAGVSFDLPAQADTLHSANKSRVKMRGKRRPQTRAARRLAAQESSEAEDMGVPRGPIAQWADGAISANGHRPQLRAASGENSTEEALAAAAAPWEGVPVPGVDRSPFAKSLGHSRGETDLFDSGDIFSTGTGSQSMERTKPKAKIAENSANPPVGSKAKSPMFPALGEASSDDDLFQSAKPKPAKKTNPFPLLEDEDDLFTDQKVKKNETKSSSQQDIISTTQDIFEDDIFATEAIKPSQKTREKEKTLESNLFDDNIDIFADLTVKPKEKSKKKVETKSIFDDDMDDIFSSGIQAKATKPKSRSAQAAPEPKSEHEVSNIFDDPLNAFGGQ
ncbi:WASH complex subunit 2A-like [Piliocolobus tephrosceles]|uniref:WASH complex subunit 2A-like n=1 Tax=Piliocolobus tephrosceles TaxID=591936 RepID=UPI000E6AEF7A|nr:WASH complex subunit 2A-like [Piliocolobus tephrosceles]